MKKISSLTLLAIVVIVGFVLSTNEFKKENNLFQKAYVRFRFYFYPNGHYRRRRYYNYDDDYYYNRYVRVEFEIYDDNNKRVEEVTIGSRRIYYDPYNSRNSARMYLTLRPGVYTIRWKVSSKRYSWSQPKVYVRRVRIRRYERWMRIIIKGDRMYVR